MLKMVGEIGILFEPRSDCFSPDVPYLSSKWVVFEFFVNLLRLLKATKVDDLMRLKVVILRVEQRREGGGHK